MNSERLKSLAAVVSCVWLMPFAAKAGVVLAAWDAAGLPGGVDNYGPSPFAPATGGFHADTLMGWRTDSRSVRHFFWESICGEKSQPMVCFSQPRCSSDGSYR
jgi:hypothetical protein